MAGSDWRKVSRGVAASGLGALALALVSCGTGTPGNVAQNGQAPTPVPVAPPARQAAQLRVGLESGECRISWNGQQVNGQGLLDAAFRELEGAIQRAGGTAAVTEQMLTATVVGNADTPWRCVGGAIAQLRRVGYARLALNIEAAAAQSILIDLPIATDAPPPPIEPQTNRVTVANDGALRWNGAPVEAQTLRSYLAATQRIVPVPRLHVEIDGQANFAAALGLLDQLRRAGLSSGPGADMPPPEEPIAPPGFDTSPSVVTEVPPPGDGFELVGLERFVPDLR